MSVPKESQTSLSDSLRSALRHSSTVLSEAESGASKLSFKHWHQRMQNEHELLRRSGKEQFALWKWCYIGCKPCRWFDSIPYEIKICKCCLKFKTFKYFGTLLLIAVFAYIFMFSLLKDELLPGGTIFFMFVLFFAAYSLGYSLMFIELPPMFGHLLVGVIFGNLPTSWLPPYDRDLLKKFTHTFERVALVVALVRAGLLLDLSQIKGRVRFILQISLFPLLAEFGSAWLFSYLLMKMPSDWGAIQGSVLCIVSLASVTNVMEKNKESGYGEDINLSTVLIAASASDVILGIFLYVTCFSYIIPRETFAGSWSIVIDVLEQIVLGLSVGSLAGLLASFFPDKRNRGAAALRIVVIGIGSIAIASILNVYDMAAAAVLGTLTMCLVAKNMWEELGWHGGNNPVQYFYTMTYQFGQPVALSLVGFSMDFKDTNSKEIGLSVVVILFGIVGREVVCFLMTLGNLYPTTYKEKIFICIAWFSKGTFQALLACAIEFTAINNRKKIPEQIFQEVEKYSRYIKQTTVLAILLTTPLACYTLTLLAPILLKKKETMNTTVEDPG